MKREKRPPIHTPDGWRWIKCLEAGDCYRCGEYIRHGVSCLYQYIKPFKPRLVRGMRARRSAMKRLLPYETATSGQRALNEMEKVLHRFGCQSFGSQLDFERSTLVVQFKHRDRLVHIEASMKGYAAAWLRAHPWSNRVRRSRVDHEREATRVASLATYSILRDWVKGQIMAVETGILSFEGAFLGQIMLPSGETVLGHLERNKLLPAST